MKNFVGNEKKVRFVETIARSGSARGSYIFTGPDGVGKLELAEYFIGLLCGENAALNIYHVKPEVIEKKKKKREAEIKVKDIRSAISFMSLKSTGTAYKACIIEKAHKMTEGAQNALLKSLEEPKRKSIFVLVADSEQKLLPTIRSRSVLIRLGLAHPQEIFTALVEAGIPAAVAAAAAYYGWGKFRQSENLATQEGMRTKMGETEERFLKYINAPIYERLQLLEKESEDATELGVRLDAWISFLAAGLERSLVDGFSLQESGTKKSYPIRNTAKMIEELIALRKKMKSGGLSVRLALEAAIINF